MKKIKLLYIFSKPRDFKHLTSYPSIIYYGYDQFIKDNNFKTSLLKKQKENLFYLLWRPFSLYFYSKTEVGFNLVQILTNLKLINSQDIVLAVNDSAGIPLVLLKKLSLIKPKIVFISAGLINNLEIHQKHWVFKFYRWFLQKADLIICWSLLERDLYKTLIGAKAEFIKLEADLSFYKQTNNKFLKDFILCVGRDVGRDFKTLFKALGELKIPIKVVTHSSHIKGLEISANIKLFTEHVAYSTLINWYKKARLVIINLKEIHRFTGQRALLEGLAMGKAVIAAKTRALISTYSLKDGKEIVFYQPEDATDLKNKIESIYNDLEKIQRLGKGGRKFVERIPKNSFYKTLKNFLLQL